MNDCIEFHFQDLLHSSRNSKNMFNSFSLLLIVFKTLQVIAHWGHCVDETNNNGSKINYANGMYYIVTLYFFLILMCGRERF